jgi:formylglycine-generating enzyme required for sulfatase activity
MKVAVLFALTLLFCSPLWAADATHAKTPKIVSKTANQLYATWKANRQKKPELARSAAEELANKYPKDVRVAKVNKWIAATEKAAALKNSQQLAIQGAPPMVSVPGKNYEIGKYEVRQAEWAAVMGANPSKFTLCGDNCPVEMVSWNDVQEYIQKLNAKTGRQYRLPTEVEWENACFGGSKTEFCGGNNPKQFAWFNLNSNNTTHPVGEKKANGYGLYDMSGNVWEWTNDCWEGDCSSRVLRGGSWSNEQRLLLATFRNRNEKTYRYLSVGFRLARSLP